MNILKNVTAAFIILAILIFIFKTIKEITTPLTDAERIEYYQWKQNEGDCERLKEIYIIPCIKDWQVEIDRINNK